MDLEKPPADWVGIIGTGQSLSLGFDSVALSTTQPFKNLMLIDEGPDPKYPTDGSASARWKTVPLTEPHRPNVPFSAMNNLSYPNNIGGLNGMAGETPHAGMANAISAAWAARGNVGDYVTVHSAIGTGGAALIYIAKGTTSYAGGLSEARVYKRLGDAAGKSYAVLGIIFTHGEADTSLQTADYDQQVFRLWSDFNTDLKTITSQRRDVVLLASQQSTVESPQSGVPPNVQLWRAGKDHPGKIVVTGPKYAYGPYYVHLPAASYQRLGEKYGEVFDLIVNRGIAWKPLGPHRITRNEATVTIDFDVPNPPLAWDTNLPQPHLQGPWAQGRGFEVSAGGQALAITAAEIVGSSVVLTLAQDPGAGPLTVAYAITGGEGENQPSRAVGQLRDSDAFAGYATESVVVQVTKGSDEVTAPAASLARRAPFDLVSGGGLPAETVVRQVGTGTLKLSAPWPGASGTATLTMHHNHHNYCVHFSESVP